MKKGILEKVFPVDIPGQPVKVSFRGEVRMETKMILTVKGFAYGGLVDADNTCDGKDMSPAITWKGTPDNAESFVIVIEDPDASVKTPDKPLFCHWIIYDIPSSMQALDDAFPKVRETAGGIKQGRNDFGKFGYGGPCPGSGEHRYIFKLFAMDCVLGLAPEEADWKGIYKAMSGHIIAESEYMGKYKRIRS
jgi:Raf kinase inhibitor-like YbhB/YbcL family protein